MKISSAYKFTDNEVLSTDLSCVKFNVIKHFYEPWLCCRQVSLSSCLSPVKFTPTYPTVLVVGGLEPTHVLQRE